MKIKQKEKDDDERGKKNEELYRVYTTTDRFILNILLLDVS
jgi:hypothetical protein